MPSGARIPSSCAARAPAPSGPVATPPEPDPCGEERNANGDCQNARDGSDRAWASRRDLRSARERLGEGRDRPIAPVRGGRERSVDHAPQRLGKDGRACRSPGGPPRQEMVEHGPQAEHVADLVGSASGEPLGARVPIIRSAAGLALPPRPSRDGSDELDQRAVALGPSEEDGAGRDRAVNDADLDAPPAGRRRPGGRCPPPPPIGSAPRAASRSDSSWPVRNSATHVGAPVGVVADLHQTRDVGMAYLARPPKLLTS